MTLILQDGLTYPVVDAESYSQAETMGVWLVNNGYTLINDPEMLLRRAYTFMQTLTYKEEYNRLYNDYILPVEYDNDGVEIPPVVFTIPPKIIQAQYYLCLCIDEKETGADLDLNKATDAKQLIHKNLGRQAIEKNWLFDKELAKTDPNSLLDRCPMASALLLPYLNRDINYQFDVRRV